MTRSNGGAKPKVLLVDDHWQVLETVSRLLTGAFDVTSICDSRTALGPRHCVSTLAGGCPRSRRPTGQAGRVVSDPVAPIDTAAMDVALIRRVASTSQVLALCDEVDRLRAEREALVAVRDAAAEVYERATHGFHPHAVRPPWSSLRDALADPRHGDVAPTTAEPSA